jgi:multiple sugar transport system permease protein
VARPSGFLLYLVAIVCSVLFMGPFFWTVSSSLKDVAEIYAFPPLWLPAQPRWSNYAEAWTYVPFGLFLLNSVTVSAFSVLGETATAALVAYGFARGQFAGRNALFVLVLSTMLLPWEVTIVPRFLLFKQLGWLDTLNPLIIPSVLGGGAFYIFLLRQFFLTIPRDFDEAAEIDGANSLQILTQVLLPLIKPALTTVAIFSFLEHWNDFIGPLMYLNTPSRFTIALGLRYFQTIPMAGQPREHLLMAAALMMSLPSVVLFFAAQRYFVRGLVMSGIKG